MKHIVAPKHAVVLAAAILSALALMLTCSTAFAEDYGEVGTPTVDADSGLVTIPVIVSDELYDQGFTEVFVKADDDLVSSVQQVAIREYGPFQVSPASPHVANVKFVLKEGVKQFAYQIEAANEQGKRVTIQEMTSYTLPTTSRASTRMASSKNQLSKTGAAVTSFVIVALLLTGAGTAFLIIRKRQR